MTQSAKPRFAPVLRALLEDDARAMDHATPEQLLDHHAGRLPPDQAALLDRHLRGCQECAGLLRDLAEFEGFTPAPAAEALEDRQAQVAWGRLQERLPGSVPAPVASPRSRPVPIAPLPTEVRLREEPRRQAKGSDPSYEPLSPRNRRSSSFLLAAALMAGVVGLGVWVVLLKQEVHQLSQPAVNVATLELQTDTVRGPERPVIPRGGGSVVILLEVPEGQTSAGFRAEIHKAGTTEPLWRAAGLYKMETGTLNFQIPRSLLPPGDYQIDVFVEDAGTSVASYPFLVSSP